MSRKELRKQAYKFIQHCLVRQYFDTANADPPIVIPLDDVVRLKEGLIDPPFTVVSVLKQVFPDQATQSEIDALLVVPFQKADNNDSEGSEET